MFVAPAVCPEARLGMRAPLHLGRLDGRRLGGCRRHTGRNHEELEGTGRPGERTHMTMAGWDAPEQSPYGAPGDNSGERGTSLLTHYSHCI